MFLYSLTLQQPSGIVNAVFGNFSAPKAQEIVVGRGKVLELLRPDENGKMHSVLAVDCFGIIRAIMPFRLTGGTKDFLVVGSDSGRIVILEYNPTKNTFDRVHCETYGKSGCRRIVPGQYLAVDPKGRAIMIGAMEKQKFVYVINRDAAARLTISSPLEAHKSHSICWALVGVDVGFDNPVFAALEIEYAEAESDPTGEAAAQTQKMLVYYELDLGLNHVTRKWSDPVDDTANLLIAVPGGSDGPSGVLVCCENFIVYKNQNHPDIKCYFPRREGQSEERGTLIVCSSTHKQKDLFFFLCQTEYGDLYKVSLATDEESNVREVRVKYFDTINTSNAICIMKHGYLFAAAEFGNHSLHQFQSIGDDDETAECSSSQMLEEGPDGVERVSVPYFRPRQPRNLLATDDVDSMSPIVDFKVADLYGEDSKQMYAACGRGARSSLRVLRHGLQVTEMAVSELPGNPNAVWSVRRTRQDAHDKYIVVSFVNATLVLSIGETVEEVTDTGFLATSTTLSVSLLGEDALLQVCPGSIRHIRSDRRVNEWRPPGKKSIVKAGVNNRQVVIGLSGGDIIHFELDQAGHLMEIAKKEMGQEVSAIDIAPIGPDRTRSRFLAVGTLDNSVRILSLDPEDHMTVLAMQALPDTAESITLQEMFSGAADATTTLFANIGLRNGVLQRTVVDSVTGQLSDTRQRFLGSRPVKTFKSRVGDRPAVLAVSSRTWQCYTWHGRIHLTPMAYETLEYASSFASEQCPEGVVAIAGNTLRIIATERLGEVLSQHSIPLTYTPRKLLMVPDTKLVVTLEADHGRYTEVERGQIVDLMRKAQQDAGIKLEKEQQEQEDADAEALAREAKAGPGHWASCIRLLDVPNGNTLQRIELENNEAAFSVTVAQFHDHPGETFLCVGTVKDLVQLPRRSHSGGFIYVYAFSPDRTHVVLYHKTPVEDVPLALGNYAGRLLAGVGKTLRVYDLGKRKLLRKCENKGFPTTITNIICKGERIYVSDAQESVHYCKYKRAENQIYIFADDSAPRWMTTQCYLDYDTIGGGDKFGNIFILRLPAEVSDEVEEDPTGGFMRYERAYLNGAPHKSENVNNFYVGDVVMGMVKGALQVGGAEAMLYGTLLGAIGAVLPFNSREDVDFFSHLEMHLRQENPPLLGRDHLAFRSSFFPVKQVVDGDLCEQFTSLPYEKQLQIAGELDRTPAEVAKKLEDIRNIIL
eukprot:tig00001024_g6316.t1